MLKSFFKSYLTPVKKMLIGVLLFSLSALAVFRFRLSFNKKQRVQNRINSAVTAGRTIERAAVAEREVNLHLSKAQLAKAEYQAYQSKLEKTNEPIATISDKWNRYFDDLDESVSDEP